TELDRGEVARQVQPFAHGYQAQCRVVVVFRLPQRRVELDDRRVERRVVDDFGHRVTRPDRGGVHERLEGRARLADRLCGATVLGVVEVPATDHGADVPGVRLERYERALEVGRERSVVLARCPGRLEVFAIGGAPRELSVRIHTGLDGVELRLHGALRRLLPADADR